MWPYGESLHNMNNLVFSCKHLTSIQYSIASSLANESYVIHALVTTLLNYGSILDFDVGASMFVKESGSTMFRLHILLSYPINDIPIAMTCLYECPLQIFV